jgi:glycosyltransferase involved in cell wall biosynthesis
MSGLKVDVIIPALNAERWIYEAVKSTQEQTLAPARIIVVDDGSMDRTGEIVQSIASRDDRVSYIRIDQSGTSVARNTGILYSSSEFIAFLDADDIWLPRKLELQMEVFSKSKRSLGFVHSSYFLMNEEGRHIKKARVFSPKLRGDLFLPILHGYPVSGSASSVVARRESLDKAGYFDGRLSFAEDWDLWIRLARVDGVDFTPEPVVGIRAHRASKQRSADIHRKIVSFENRLLVYQKWERFVAQDFRLKDNLRRKAGVLALRSLMRNPMGLRDLHQRLLVSSNPLARSLFLIERDLWKMVFLSLLEITIGRLWSSVRSLLGLKKRGGPGD